MPKSTADLAIRKPVPAPRPAVVPRPSLPSPITPLRPRSAPEPAPEPARPVPEPPKLSEAPILAPPPVVTETPSRPRKDDSFYDLESLEAEMARLLGRDA